MLPQYGKIVSQILFFWISKVRDEKIFKKHSPLPRAHARQHLSAAHNKTCHVDVPSPSLSLNPETNIMIQLFGCTLRNHQPLLLKSWSLKRKRRFYRNQESMMLSRRIVSVLSHPAFVSSILSRRIVSVQTHPAFAFMIPSRRSVSARKHHRFASVTASLPFVFGTTCQVSESCLSFRAIVCDLVACPPP